MRTPVLYLASAVVITLAWGCRGKVTEKTPIYRLPITDLAYLGPVGEGDFIGDTNGVAVKMRITGQRNLGVHSNYNKYNSNIDDYYDIQEHEVRLGTQNRFLFSSTFVQNATATGPTSFVNLSLKALYDSGRGYGVVGSAYWKGKALAAHKKQVELVPGQLFDCVVLTPSDSFFVYNYDNSSNTRTTIVKEVVYARNIGFVRAHLIIPGWYRNQPVTREYQINRRLQ